MVKMKDDKKYETKCKESAVNVLPSKCLMKVRLFLKINLREMFVHIPLWVDKFQVICRIDERSAKNHWYINYLRFKSLKNNDQIIVEFPVEERVEKWEIPDYSKIEPAFQQNWPKWEGQDNYSLKFKGNTLIEISSRFLKGLPCYKKRPEKYMCKEAPAKKILRFETPFLLEW